MVTGLSHVSIAVPDLEAAARQLNDKYGLRVGARMVNAEQGVCRAWRRQDRADRAVAAGFADRQIPRTQPKGGIHHFCLSVDDVGKTAHAFAQNGVRLLGAGKPQRNVAGEPIAFLHPGDFLGALVELEEHKG